VAADGPGDPLSPYISDRNVRVEQDRRALANTKRSNGEDDGDTPLAGRPGNPGNAPVIPREDSPTPTLPAAPPTASRAAPRPIGPPASVPPARATPPPRPVVPTPPAERDVAIAPAAATRASDATEGAGTAAPEEVDLPYVIDAAGPAPASGDTGLRLTVGALDGGVPADHPPTEASAAAHAPRRPARSPAARHPTPAPMPPTPNPSVSEPPAADAPAPPVAAPVASSTSPAPPTEASSFFEELWTPSAELAADVRPPDGSDAPVPTDAPVDTRPFDPAHAGRDDTDDETKARGWADIAVLEERTVLAEDTRFSARESPEGQWMASVYAEASANWVYPATLRALGTQGTVVVRFRVRRDGTVEDPSVLVPSGTTELDLAALAALPAHVAPFPAGVAGNRLYIRLTFRYREPARGR
jgi:TonB family protein